MNSSYLLIRFIPGLIFLSKGIQKFILPELVGPGRFAKLGFQYPEFWAFFAGSFEIFMCDIVVKRLIYQVGSYSTTDRHDSCHYYYQSANIDRKRVLDHSS
jgi:hypothetical protein